MEQEVAAMKRERDSDRALCTVVMLFVVDLDRECEVSHDDRIERNHSARNMVD